MDALSSPKLQSLFEPFVPASSRPSVIHKDNSSQFTVADSPPASLVPIKQDITLRFMTRDQETIDLVNSLFVNGLLLILEHMQNPMQTILRNEEYFGTSSVYTQAIHSY